jgi:hypothetical protein
MESDFTCLSAHQVTQYMRGELFIFHDSLLHLAIPKEHTQEALNFHYKMLEYVHKWLIKMPSLLPLQAELRANSDLYMIDQNIAVYECFKEMSEILQKLFGSCSRNHKFFWSSDQEPRNDFTKVVAKVSEEFQVDEKAQEEFDVDDAKEAIMKHQVDFGQQCNFINHFASIGGFDAILNLVKSGTEGQEKVSLILIQHFTSIMKGTFKVIDTEFAYEYVTQMSDLVVKRFEAISDKEL